MRYEPISSSLFSARRNDFAKLMKKNAVAIFFSNDEMLRSGDQTFPFHQQSDLFAMSGLDQPGSALVLNPGAVDPHHRVLAFILPTDPHHTTWNGKRYSKAEARKVSGIHSIYTTHQWKRIITPLIASARMIYVNSTMKENPMLKLTDQNQRKAFGLQQEWPGKQFLSSKPLLEKLMMVKNPIEINLMKRAIWITGKAFETILPMVKPGMKEYELEAELTRIIIGSGGQHAFQPIIASGKSACTLHYVSNDGVLRPGTLTLLDFGAQYAYMNADMSRTIPVSGRFTRQQKVIYLEVLNMLNMVTDLMRPGITLAELNKETGKMMDAALIRLKLLARNDIRRQDPSRPLRRKYFMHGVSHHLGWNVHDQYENDAPLKSGMVLTCEPGLYIPEEKTGIRLENDILITRGQPINLMKNIPIDPDEIEDLMNRI